jgi:hypothetical protein
LAAGKAACYTLYSPVIEEVAPFGIPNTRPRFPAPTNISKVKNANTLAALLCRINQLMLLPKLAIKDFHHPSSSEQEAYNMYERVDFSFHVSSLNLSARVGKRHHTELHYRLFVAKKSCPNAERATVLKKPSTRIVNRTSIHCP